MRDSRHSRTANDSEQPRQNVSRMVLIIGYGNPLRRDDGAGWVAIQHLAEDKRSDMHLLACHQLTPELAEPISQAALVIFIDACVADGCPDEPRCAWLLCQPVVADGAVSASLSHHVHPSALLAYARTLYGTTPTAFLLTIASTAFGYGETVSPGVLATMPALIEEVQTLVTRHAPTTC